MLVLGPAGKSSTPGLGFMPVSPSFSPDPMLPSPSAPHPCPGAAEMPRQAALFRPVSRPHPAFDSLLRPAQIRRPRLVLT